MIKPTVGRIVLFWHTKTQNEPFPAIIVKVNSDTNINICYFSQNGYPRPKENVYLWDGTLVDGIKPGWPYAEWMEYQLKVAKEKGTK